MSVRQWGFCPGFVMVWLCFGLVSSLYSFIWDQHFSFSLAFTPTVLFSTFFYSFHTLAFFLSWLICFLFFCLFVCLFDWSHDKLEIDNTNCLVPCFILSCSKCQRRIKTEECSVYSMHISYSILLSSTKENVFPHFDIFQFISEGKYRK